MNRAPCPTCLGRGFTYHWSDNSLSASLCVKCFGSGRISPAEAKEA